MSWPILSVAIEREGDVVAVRQRARRLSELLGFGVQDQTRFATAVSEIARNAFDYAGGGRAEFLLEGAVSPQHLRVRVRDQGRGIDDLDGVLSGRRRSEHGLGVGLSGSRRLVDRFDVESAAGVGTVVTLDKRLPGPGLVRPDSLADIARRLAGEGPNDPLAEMREQNQALVRSLIELGERQSESAQLNAELEATNRGVVALYAELDGKAAELATLNASLAERVEAAVLAREQAEDGLRQAQKMEAVGQLTGGIAHDFNNLLQIVTGNLERLERDLPEELPKLRRAARNAMEGATRAATLTARLLAFSRRQPLAPEVIDPNALVRGMVELLQRTLGEPVRIETALAADLWTVEADPNQLENALLNLAVNARDAMPEGGVLRLETEGVVLDAERAERAALPPGDYVAVRVGDTGAGMSPDVLARVFEPFYTTKAVGKGTGLGLSMVYGFARQSGGGVELASTPGQGTVVTLHLPRSRAVATPAAAGPARSTPRGEGETVLVVEDEPAVRAYSVEALRELGYDVVEAEDGDAALARLAERPDVALLFTDVVLPGRLSGRDLADAALAARPDARVLFTTGYARDVIVHDGRLDADVALLSKPFTFDQLAEKVRSALDMARPADAR